MGNQHMKPEDKLKHINIEVNSLRTTVRRTRREATKASQEAHYKTLVKYSKEASSLKGKVREGDLMKTQENISKTVTEVLSIPIQERDSTLDSGAIKTDSFIQVSMSRRRSSSKAAPVEIPVKKSASKRNTMSKHVSTLEDIDLKFISLKPQIKTAIDNKNNTQLRVHKKTIEVLATDLEMIEILGDTPLGDRKEKLVSSLTSQYQRINSAMKDIRRSKDIDYLLEQNNNTLMKKLEEIRKELGKTDAALKEALKNDDLDTIRTGKEDLVKINQRLSSLEIVDGNTKRMKMQMVDQITWLYKYINDFTQKGSQSDLTKAQVNYEDLIKNIASGKIKNEEDIKVKLESLQSFVNTIDDMNESDSKKKKQLLNNINDTFSSFGGVSKNEAVVQVNQSKQPNNKKAVDILKEVNQFCESIERSIEQVRFTEAEFENLIRILGNVMRSIESMRENIAADKPKLNKMRNYSTPDLTGSRTSQVELDKRSSTLGNVTKKNVRVYDLETSRKETVESHSVLPGFYRDENCFSAVDQIRTQVNYIKEKIHEIEDDTHVRNKLTTFRKTLQMYSNHTNQTIANNAKLVSADIQELFTNISNSQEIKQIYLYGKIETIQDSFEHMKKIVEEFFDKRESDSFEMITEQLMMCEKYLLANKKITNDQRDEVISKFRSLMKTFEKKANIKETLTSLKERVNRFAGAYKGVLYNKIEKDMNKIMIDASEHIENKKISDEITTQAEKHLKILENRATREQSFRRTISETPISLDDGKIMKLRSEIENIRHDMEMIVCNDVDSFIHVKSRLDLVTLELGQLKKYNENEDQMKISIQNEVDALKIIVDAKIATAMESRKVLLIKKDKNTEEKLKTRLDTIEKNLNALKIEIEQFVGTTSDNEFYELDEYAIRLILKINDMEDFPEGSELHNRRVKLMKEAQQCSDILNRRANETETLIDYERSITDIENNLDHYTKSTKDLEKLAEHIKLVKEDLERTNFNRNLRERKRSCVEQIDSVVKKIGDKSNMEENIMPHTGVPERQTTKIVHDNVSTSTDDQLNGKLKIGPLNNNDMKRPEKQQKQNNSDMDHKTRKDERKSEDTYIGSVSFLKDVERNRTKKSKDETNPVLLELDEIKKVAENLNKEISGFDNSETSGEYRQLEDNILKLNVRLNLLNITKDDDFYSRKLELEQQISNCLEYLDKRMQALEIISGIEIELNRVSKCIDEWTSKEENDKLDEKLIDLQVTLGKIQLDDEPNQRKLICIETIKKFLRKLKENRELIHDTSV